MGPAAGVPDRPDLLGRRLPAGAPIPRRLPGAGRAEMAELGIADYYLALAPDPDEQGLEAVRRALHEVTKALKSPSPPPHATPARSARHRPCGRCTRASIACHRRSHTACKQRRGPTGPYPV